MRKFFFYLNFIGLLLGLGLTLLDVEDTEVVLSVMFLVGSAHMIQGFVFLFFTKHLSKHLQIHFIVSAAYLILLPITATIGLDLEHGISILLFFGPCAVLAVYFVYGLYSSAFEELDK